MGTGFVGKVGCCWGGGGVVVCGFVICGFVLSDMVLGADWRLKLGMGLAWRGLCVVYQMRKLAGGEGREMRLRERACVELT